MDEEQITVVEAASRLGVTTRTIRLWITSGRLSAERMRGRFGPEWRIPERELVRMAEAKAETALVTDPAGKLGRNEFRASLGLILQETGALQRQMSENAQHMKLMGAQLDRMAAVLEQAEGQVEVLQAQNQDLQRALADVAHGQQRQSQELQTGLQSTTGLLHEEQDLLQAVQDRLDMLSRPRRSWWSRIWGGKGSG